MATELEEELAGTDAASEWGWRRPPVCGPRAAAHGPGEQLTGLASGTRLNLSIVTIRRGRRGSEATRESAVPE